MQESKKEMLLKGVCCLMLLQINGEARGSAHIRSAQKQLTHLQKGFPTAQQFQILPREALPVKDEVVAPVDDNNLDGFDRMRFAKIGKKSRDLRGHSSAFSYPRKTNMYFDGKMKRSKPAGTRIKSNQKSLSSFQWTRISTRQSGKQTINRSVANRNFEYC